MKLKYYPKKETLEVKEDIDGNGTPDITVKIRLSAVIKRYGKHISGAGLILAALAAAHSLGWL